jgi:hypothetical protein
MQVEIVGERKKEKASIILVGILLGICFAALMGSVAVLISIHFGIEINLWNMAILSLIAGILLGETIEMIIFRFSKQKDIPLLFLKGKG